MHSFWVLGSFHRTISGCYKLLGLEYLLIQKGTGAYSTYTVVLNILQKGKDKQIKHDFRYLILLSSPVRWVLHYPLGRGTTWGYSRYNMSCIFLLLFFFFFNYYYYYNNCFLHDLILFFNGQYVLYGPFMAKVLYERFYEEDFSLNLSWCLHLLILFGLRGFLHVLWNSYSNMLFLTRNRRILQQGIDFKQVDKEWDW